MTAFPIAFLLLKFKCLQISAISIDKISEASVPGAGLKFHIGGCRVIGVGCESYCAVR